MKNTDEYKTEEEYEAIFAQQVDILNQVCPLKDGQEFCLNYAYGGVRLTKGVPHGGQADMSVRFFYDEDGTADYDAFMDMLYAITNVLMVAKREGR